MITAKNEIGIREMRYKEKKLLNFNSFAGTAF